MVFRHASAKFLVVASLVSFLAILPGCVVSGSRRTETIGDFVGKHTFSMIKPGKTDKAWILAALGEPTRKSTATDKNQELWVWASTRTRHADTEVLIIFDGNKNVKTIQHVYIEFEGDLVSRAWRDSSR